MGGTVVDPLRGEAGRGLRDKDVFWNLLGLLALPGLRARRSAGRGRPLASVPVPLSARVCRIWIPASRRQADAALLPFDRGFVHVHASVRALSDQDYGTRLCPSPGPSRQGFAKGLILDSGMAWESTVWARLRARTPTADSGWDRAAIEAAQ